MRYQSTRGKTNDCTFKAVTLSGFADDGGLFLPSQFPKVTHEKLLVWAKLSYADLCKEILSIFISTTDLNREILNEIIDTAFQTFDCKEVIPVKKLKEHLYVAELWHGRTWAFKDLALSCLSRFVNHYSKVDKIHRNVICATSGDTGTSAIDSVRTSDYLDIFVMYPKGRCSQIQQKQLTAVSDKNVHVFEGEGTSDDFDVVVKSCFSDETFSQTHNLISFSSINWSRILVQMVHYFYTYLQTVSIIGDEVTIVVPSGGLGNLTAGFIAATMGLPIKLIASTNQNDVTHKIFQSGDFIKPEKVFQSTSCSMDICVPMNIERIIYLASGMNAKLVCELMEEYEKNGKVKIPPDVLREMQKFVFSATVSEDNVKEAIQECWHQWKYFIDPHTAVGMAVILFPERYNLPIWSKHVLSLSTASPAKFPECFKELDIPFQISKEVKDLLKTPSYYKTMKDGENWEEILKESIMLTAKRRLQECP